MTFTRTAESYEEEAERAFIKALLFSIFKKKKERQMYHNRMWHCLLIAEGIRNGSL